MTKYHVNSEGNVGVCKATVKDCPLSPAEEHFTSREEARLHAEKILASEFERKRTVNFPKEDSLRTMAPGVPEDLEAHAAKALAAMGHLSDLERMALRGYGGFAAGVANSYLLGEEYEPYDKAPPWRESNGPTDFNSIEELKDYIQVMDSIFTAREDEERILYRGIPIYSSIHEEMERLIGEKFRPSDTERQLKALEAYFSPGRVFEYPTYLSTSHSPEIAADRTDNIAGTKQEYLYQKAEISGIQKELKTNAGVDITGAVRDHYRLEREVVLPRNLKFKVEKLILRPQEYKTSVAGEETTFTGIAAVVQLSEVAPE